MPIHPVAVFPADPTDRPKVAVLLNTCARSVTPRVIRAVGQVVPPRDLYVSRSLEEARSIVSEVHRRGYDTVLMGGGDGTFVGFLNAMLEEHAGPGFATDGSAVRALATDPLPRLGVLRLGTGNALATLTGASSLRASGVLEDILHTRAGRVRATRRLDLAAVEGIRAPFAGIGYDALVLNNYVRMKRWLAPTPARAFGEGVWGYGLSTALLSVPQAILRTFPEVEIRNIGAPARLIGPDGEPVGAPIEAGERLYAGPVRMVSAGTCPYYGFGFTMFPFAGKMPGRLQLRVATTSVPKALANLPSVWRGRFRDASVVDFYAEAVEVRCAGPMPLQIGGDAAGYRERFTFGVSAEPVDLLDFGGR
jgi:diacylglycerol kinase family enzyme